jgi:hypothetical protein
VVSVTTGDSVSVASTPRQLDDEDGLSVSRRRREVKCVQEWESGPDGVWLLAVEGCVTCGFVTFQNEPGTGRILLLLAESNKPSKTTTGLEGPEIE